MNPDALDCREARRGDLEALIASFYDDVADDNLGAGFSLNASIRVIARNVF